MVVANEAVALGHASSSGGRRGERRQSCIPTTTTMDFLHTQLEALQRQLSWVQTDPIDWKLYVQAFSWTVCLFETYLLCVVPLECLSF